MREFWRTHRTRPWLFPSRMYLRSHPEATTVPEPIGRSALQSAFVRGCRKAGIEKKAHIHTLRHSYATHLLEDGVSQRALMDLLGHTNAQSTAIYTHLTTHLRDQVQNQIDRLMS